LSAIEQALQRPEVQLGVTATADSIEQPTGSRHKAFPT
jgi:hypothetical protein